MSNSKSSQRLAFEAAAKDRRWDDAYFFFNGLNMEEMLASLADLPRMLVGEFWAENGSYLGKFGVDRIGFAVFVVQHNRLPREIPAFLPSDQEAAAWSFLKHRPVDRTSNPPMDSITVDQLQHVMTRLTSDELAAVYTALMNEAMPLYGINTRLRWAAFLAQIGHESGDLTHWDELPSAFASSHSKYHGRGPIQLTGIANYRAAGVEFGEDLVKHPERAAAQDLGFKIAGWFWMRAGLNSLADRGQFLTITRRINGPKALGEHDRERHHDLALRAF